MGQSRGSADTTVSDGKSLSITRRDALSLAGGALVAGGMSRREPIDMGAACFAGADLVRPGRYAGRRHALYGAVRVARRAGETAAGYAQRARSRRIMDSRRRRPQL